LEPTDSRRDDGGSLSGVHRDRRGFRQGPAASHHGGVGRGSSGRVVAATARSSFPRWPAGDRHNDSISIWPVACADIAASPLPPLRHPATPYRGGGRSGRERRVSAIGRTWQGSGRWHSGRPSVALVSECVGGVPPLELVALVSLAPRAAPLPYSERVTFGNVISPGWFDTFGTRLIAGRDLMDSDRQGMPAVAVVNQAFARTFLNGASPLGHTIVLSGWPIEVHPSCSATNITSPTVSALK
jgi:hypothetical protein